MTLGAPDPLAVALNGPPRGFWLDAERYRVRSWAPLLRVLPVQRWHAAVVLGVLREDSADRLRVRLLDPSDPLDLPDLEPVAEALVQAATGWAWWSARRLTEWAAVKWPEVDGALRLRGVVLPRLFARQPGAGCDVLYALAAENATQKDRAKLDAELTRPPPEVMVDPPDWAIEANAARFAAAMSRPPPGVSTGGGG